ncbi:MAG: hypothetical protein GXO22_01745 [Aquificae bacterium]|nr:hypothetical protein [Aquificota bacterium]
MFNKIWIFLFAFSIFLFSCATSYKTTKSKLNKKATYAVVPFYNFTETPMAGLRVSHLIEGVLRAKNYRVLNRYWKEEEDLSAEEIKNLITELKNKNVNYIVSGTVNEWRYKTGIDGEPAVSFTIYVLDTSTGNIVWSGALSRSGLSYESLGVTAQSLIEKVIK